MLLAAACSNRGEDGAHTYQCYLACTKGPEFPQICADDVPEARTTCVEYIQGCHNTKDPTLLRKDYCTLKGKLMSVISPEATYVGQLEQGLSWVTIRNKDDGDSVTTTLKGALAMNGGNCPNATCPLTLTYVTFSVPEFQLSGRNVTGLVAQNQGLWATKVLPDGSIPLGNAEELVLAARVDGKYILQTARTPALRVRFATVGQQLALVVDGTFLAQGMKVELQMHLHIWLADCRPKARAAVSCDKRGYSYLLDGSASQAKLVFGKTSEICYNMMKAKPSLSHTGFPPIQGDELLYTWSDASGQVLANSILSAKVQLPARVAFPIRLKVTNEFGMIDEAVIRSNPCP
jgi:hypothetical protein